MTFKNGGKRLQECFATNKFFPPFYFGNKKNALF